MISLSENKHIQIMQQNLHRSKEVNLELLNWLNRLGDKPGIALVQEPNNNKGKLSNLSPKYKQFSDTGGCSVRAAVVTTPGLDCWKLSQYCGPDIATIAVKHKNNRITVLSSIYMPYDSDLPPPGELTTSLTNFCEQRSWGLIIGTDANSHHTVWGSGDDNARGEHLLDYIVTTTLQICNIGNTPTFENAVRSEVIDLTLATANIVENITEWKVSQENTLSDHNRITFMLTYETQIINLEYRNVRKTDWSKYRKKLQEALNDMGDTYHQTNLDGKALLIEKGINEAFEHSCPLRVCKRNKKPLWWNNQLEALKREALRQRNKYKRLKTEEKKAEWKQAANAYKTAMKRAQRENWENFCSETKDCSAIAKLQKLMKQDKRAELGTIRKQNGEFTTTPEETLEVMLKTLFPDKDETHNNPGETNQIKWTNEEPLDIDDIVNEESVTAAINSFKPYKSPGPDMIRPALLQQGLNMLLPYLVDIYRHSLMEETPAKTWLRTKAVFIPKPGKADYADPKSFRPISLSAFMLKGLERLILWHLQRTMLKEKPFNRNLYSYQEGLSTDTALHRVISKVEKTLEENKVAIVVFLDISGAFSDASITGLLKPLARRNINKKLGEWIKNMLENRKVTAELGSSATSKELNRGTPQGGILSPMIFNVDVEECIENLPENSPTEGHGYADDIAAIGTGIDEKIIAERIQNDLKALEDWAARNTLAFNPDKTKVMIFSRKRNTQKPDITMNGKKLEYVEEFKYLGVNIDSKLLWTKHLKKQANKAQMALITGRRMIGKNWGLTPKNASWLYQCIVRPIVTYGAIVWANATEKSNIKKKLNKIQRTACLMITGAMRSTPTAGMEMILDLRPIYIHILEHALASYTRLVGAGSWRPKPGEPLWKRGHTEFITNLGKLFDDIKKPQDTMIRTVRLQSNFKTIIEDRVNVRKVRPRPKDEMEINCFTDGSKNENTTGAGYIYMSNHHKEQDSIYLGKQASVFQAEVTAISQACITMLQNETTDHKINIYIDSQAAIKALCSYETRSKCVLNCKELLNEVGRSNQLMINWIPGHEGHMGNEVADQLAKRGLHKTVLGPEPIIPLNATINKQQIRNWALRQHNKEWITRTDCRQTKLLLPEVNKRWSREILKRKRKTVQTLTQIITGHAHLRRHRYLMGMEDDPTCPRCNEEDETTEHYLVKCPAYAEPRYQTFGKAIMKIEEMRGETVKSILCFVERTGRFIQQ